MYYSKIPSGTPNPARLHETYPAVKMVVKSKNGKCVVHCERVSSQMSQIRHVAYSRVTLHHRRAKIQHWENIWVKNRA